MRNTVIIVGRLELKRFKVINESHQGNYYMNATIVDLNKPVYHCDDTKKITPMWYTSVCEFPSISDAEKVCEMLNELECQGLNTL